MLRQYVQAQDRPYHSILFRGRCQAWQKKEREGVTYYSGEVESRGHGGRVYNEFHLMDPSQSRLAFLLSYTTQVL